MGVARATRVRVYGVWYGPGGHDQRGAGGEIWGRYGRDTRGWGDGAQHAERV